MSFNSNLQRTHGSSTNRAALNTQYTMPQWHQLLLTKRKSVKIKTVDELIREPKEELGLNDGKRISSIHRINPATSLSALTTTSILTQLQKKTDESQNIIISEKLTESQNVLLSRPKPIHNPQDPNDDLKIEWTPHELIHAAVALSNYNVKPLYSRKDPNAVKRVLYIVLLVEKYKPLLKELLKHGRYFESFPEDLKDEPVVNVALLDLLCRGDGPSIEEQLDMSARVEYKNCGLKVVYLQLEKCKKQYYEMVHERLRQCHVTSFYQLLPSQVPIALNLQHPKKFDIWINKNKLGTKWVKDRVILEDESHFKPAGAVRKKAVTYREIKILPFFYELETANFSDFLDSTNYHNNVFIPADRNHCLGITELIKQLIKLNRGKGTVIQTHVLSLSATAYFAYLLSVCFNPPMKLKVFGADKMKESFDSYFDLLCLKNIKVFSKRFYIQNPRRKDIAKTVSVLVNPETTFNPSVNIIDEAVKRGCDITYLQSTYEIFSQEDVHSLHFSYQQKRDLRDFARYNMRRALTIPKVKFVVYQSFDQSETPTDNNGSYVMNYMTECQHDTEVSINSDMSKTDPEFINYNYCATLDSCFQQGNPVQHPFSTEVWGSDPPFIAVFYRTEPVIPSRDTDEEHKGKSVSWHSDIKSSSIDSGSHKTASQDHQFEIEPTPSATNKDYDEQKVYDTSQKSKTVFKSPDKPEKNKDVLTPIMLLPPRSSHTSVSAVSKFSKQSRRTLFRGQHRTNDCKRLLGLDKKSSREVKKMNSQTSNKIQDIQARKSSLRDKRNLFKKRFNENEKQQEIMKNHKEKELSKTNLGVENMIHFRAQHGHTNFSNIANSENKTRGEGGNSFLKTSMKDLDKDSTHSVKKKSIFSEKKLGAKKEELADLKEIEKLQCPTSSISLKEKKSPNKKINGKELIKKGSFAKEDTESKQEFAGLKQAVKLETNGIFKNDRLKPKNKVHFTKETESKVEQEKGALSSIERDIESDSDLSNNKIPSENIKRSLKKKRDFKKELAMQEYLSLKQNFHNDWRPKNEQNYSSSNEDDEKYEKKLKKRRSKNKTILQTKSNLSKKAPSQLLQTFTDFKKDRSTSDDSSITIDSAKNNANKMKCNLELSLVLKNENIPQAQLRPLNFKQTAELKRKENNDETNFSSSEKEIKKKRKVKKLFQKRSITGNEIDSSSMASLETVSEGTSQTKVKYEKSQGTQTILKDIEKGNRANEIDVFFALDGRPTYRDSVQDSMVHQEAPDKKSDPNVEKKGEKQHENEDEANEESSKSDVEKKAKIGTGQKVIEKEKKELKKPKPPSKESEKLVDIVPRRTRELSKLAKELYQIRDIVEYYLHTDEERQEKSDEKKDSNKHAHGEPCQQKWKEFCGLIDNVPHKTPTKGLSKLAKQLYNIRDIVEHYLKSKEEPRN